MQLARLQRPRAQQNYYGAPGLPMAAPAYAGATMAPPMPAAPRMSAASMTATAPYMPTPAAPVTTNPSLTPFQLSVNNQRANESMKAATFARNAPLPMAPVPMPAIQPTASPAMMPYAPGMAQPATVPMGQQPPAAPETPVPQMQYSGAHGVGPQAEQTARAARAAFISSHEDIANAQDRGPGLGVNSYANADLQRDANQRANDAAENGSPDDELKRAKAADAQSKADSRTATTPAMVQKAQEAAKLASEKAADLLKTRQSRIDARDAATKLAGDRGNALRTNTDTAANREKRLGAQGNSRNYNAEDKSATEDFTAARTDFNAFTVQINKHDELLNNVATSEKDKARLLAEREALQAQQKAASDEMHAAQKRGKKARKEAAAPVAPATQPAAGAPATQPAANAQPLVGHDPAKRTPEAIAETARNRGISEDEVLRRLGVTA